MLVPQRVRIRRSDRQRRDRHTVFFCIVRKNYLDLHLLFPQGEILGWVDVLQREFPPEIYTRG
jgi:hypothetical protein